VARKTQQEIARENLETAERVKVKADDRLTKAAAAHEKAKQDAALADRKVRAARLIADEEDIAAEIDSTVTPAAAPAGDDSDDLV